MFKPDKTYVFALGGLGEVGKNMYCFMQNDEIIIVDAGVIFPDSELRGIDYVLPDFDFLKKNEKKIKTLIITHGHEDHIGAIPFLLQNIHIPTIFAPNQAYALIKKKLEDRNIQYKGLRPYKSDDKLKYKNCDISSSRIRETVVAGDIEQVNLMLGYPYTIIGEVVEGNKLGRELGFPTANIKPDDRKILPPYGVYYTKVIVEGKEYKGITNIGKKPTVSGENSIGVETYLLDYSGDLYEKILETRFYKYKRPERKFSDVEELKEEAVPMVNIQGIHTIKEGI